MNSSVKVVGSRTGLLVVIALGAGTLLPLVLFAIFMFAPEEVSMGNVQRLVYFHVSVAWCGLAAYLAMSILSGVYLVRRELVWDHWSQATAEVGWLCTTLTLITGSLWAHEAWNTWWTWEPRLTASLILWSVYAGYFLVRSALDDPQHRGRISGILALLGSVDLPLVIMATRWFRGIHPISPEMDPRMRLVLLASVISFSIFFCLVASLRFRQLALAETVVSLEHQVTA
jgi:heme exporter protein C